MTALRAEIRVEEHPAVTIYRIVAVGRCSGLGELQQFVQQVAHDLFVQSCEPGTATPEVLEGSGVTEFKDQIRWFSEQVRDKAVWDCDVAQLNRGEPVELFRWQDVHDKSHVDDPDKKSYWLGR